MNRLKLPVESRPDFMALPSDPHLTTPEQEAGFWGGDVNKVLVGLGQDYSTYLASLTQQSALKDQAS